MKMIPGQLYSYNCSASGGGFFYGIYTHSGTYDEDLDEPSYWFDYVSSPTSEWCSSDFCCRIEDSDKLTHIGSPSDFPELLI